jgi:hypothetical protein
MAAEPTIESANTLFHDRSVRLIGATGGPGLVKAAFSAGKKVIAAGPGNPPVLVDQTADLDRAARSIIDGASFDNNILCIAGKNRGRCGVNPSWMRWYGPARCASPRSGEGPRQGVPEMKGRGDHQPRLHRQNASVLARAAGLSIGDDVGSSSGSGFGASSCRRTDDALHACRQ